MKPARIFLLPAAFILSGCVLNQPSLPDHPLPQDWKNAAGFPTASVSKDLSRWWNRFHDPVLNRLITKALESNPDLAIASSNIRASKANLTAARSSLFPYLGGSTSASTSSTYLDGNRVDTSESYSAGLNASWEIDLFGRNRSATQAAVANVGAAEENFHSVQASLASQVANAYLTLRSTEAQLDLVRRTIETREETYNLTEWQRQAGETDALSTNQSLTSLEQARASIPSFQQTAEQTKNLLCRLCGLAPGGLDTLIGNSNGKIPQPDRELAIGIPADTLRQRPDLRLAGYQWLAAAANTRSAQADRFPTLNLTGSLGINSLSASKLFDPETATTNLIAGLTGPIFDAGRIRSNIAFQSEVQEQSLQTYYSTVLVALSETEDALIACRRIGEQLASTEKAADAARKADQLARQRYQTGVVDLLTVLDTQRTLLSLDQSLISLRANRAAAFIDLYIALGGGWSR